MESKNQKLFDLRKAYLERANGGQVDEKQFWQTVIIVTRMMARETLKLYNNFNDERLRWQHVKNQMKQQGICVLFAEAKLYEAEQQLKQAREDLITHGQVINSVLTLWQFAGATLEDFCKLCNLNYEKVIQKHPGIEDRDLADVAMVYNLDYQRNGGGWIDTRLDGPFTHCLNEYMFHLIDTDPIAQEAAHIALLEVFPDLFENAYTSKMGEDGNMHLFDSDGNDVGILETNN